MRLCLHSRFRHGILHYFGRGIGRRNFGSRLSSNISRRRLLPLLKRFSSSRADNRPGCGQNFVRCEASVILPGKGSLLWLYVMGHIGCGFGRKFLP